MTVKGKIVYIPPERCHVNVNIEETPHGYRLFRDGGIILQLFYQKWFLLNTKKVKRNERIHGSRWYCDFCNWLWPQTL